jgi:hypothetical protein
MILSPACFCLPCWYRMRATSRCSAIPQEQNRCQDRGCWFSWPTSYRQRCASDWRGDNVSSEVTRCQCSPGCNSRCDGDRLALHGFAWLRRYHSSCLACHQRPTHPRITGETNGAQAARLVASSIAVLVGAVEEGRGALTGCPPEHDILSTQKGQTRTANRRSPGQKASCWVGCVWYKTCLEESLE